MANPSGFQQSTPCLNPIYRPHTKILQTMGVLFAQTLWLRNGWCCEYRSNHALHNDFAAIAQSAHIAAVSAFTFLNVVCIHEYLV